MLAASLIGFSAPTSAQLQAVVQTPDKTSNMKIRIRIADQAPVATLSDSATSRDLISLLPLTLNLTDYAATERISDLPRRLSTKDAPAGSTPSKGDIAYYAPWGNLAIFHADFRYSAGLIKLGKIESGMTPLD
jgi:hypothetical protein